MKRYFAFAMVLCLLLCGCQASPEPTEPSTQNTQQEETTTAAPTEETTTQPKEAETTAAEQEEKYTVYLLDEVVSYDNGFAKYSYDANYNIDSYTQYSLEKEMLYTVYFEQKDSNGMACQYRSAWPDGSGETRTLVYFLDGKLKEELYVGSNFSGYQYEYDQKGDITEKREYYDGILESIVHYEYDGETLKAVYGEDKEGNKLFDCRIENGRIIEKVCYDSETPYSYTYEYDSNGNLVKTSFIYDGEVMPGDQYSYKTVEVDYERAGYLKYQQQYLIKIV